MPQYATAGSSGLDLRADLNSPVELQAMERKLVPTGLFIGIPEGYEAQVRPRSGLAINYGITCLNSPGTIDSDYRGEIKIVLINLSGEKQIINPGDRIAQLVLQKVEKIIWEHGRRNFSLRADGVLAIVCPIADNSGTVGVGIFNDSTEKVKEIMDEDPAVKEGVFVYEVHPCRSFPGDCLPG